MQLDDFKTEWPTDTRIATAKDAIKAANYSMVQKCAIHLGFGIFDSSAVNVSDAIGEMLYESAMHIECQERLFTPKDGFELIFDQIQRDIEGQQRRWQGETENNDEYEKYCKESEAALVNLQGLRNWYLNYRVPDVKYTAE